MPRRPSPIADRRAREAARLGLRPETLRKRERAARVDALAPIRARLALGWIGERVAPAGEPRDPSAS